MKKHPQANQPNESDKGRRDPETPTGSIQPSAAPAASSGGPADQQKLFGALETLREVLVSKEVTALRGSLGDTKSDLSRRLDETVKKSTDSIDKVMKDLSGRIDALNPKFDAMEDQQKKELHEAKEKTARSIADMKKDMREAQEQTKAQFDSLKQDLEKMLAEKEAALQTDVGRLGQGLTALQNGLREQAVNSQRMSGLLQNMGQLFSGAPAQAAPPADDGSLDNALDQMFQEVEAGAPQPESSND